MKLVLKDIQITINGFVSNCRCKCKHCLLCSGDNKIDKVSYEKLEELALKFKNFYQSTGIDVGLAVYNCSEYVELPRAININKKISRVYGYQNLNGTEIRQGKELSEWVTYLKNIGVTNANISWFGDKDFHNSFVNRKDYFEYLFELASELQTQKLAYNNSIFILKSNIKYLEKLYNMLLPLGGTFNFSILDYRGNAKDIHDEFITIEDLERLPSSIFNKKI